MNNCCETLVNLPGSAGAPACTNLLADITLPTSGNNVTVNVVNTSQMVPETNVVMPGPAHFQIVSISSATQAVLKFLAETGDLVAGSTVATGALVCPTGQEGPDGTNGANGFAITTSDFQVPSVGSTVTVPVDDSDCFVVGQFVVADGPANFIVTAVPSSTQVTIWFLGNANDVSPGATIAAGATIAPAGSAGQNAYTTLTSQLTVPAKGSTVDAAVVSTAWMVSGQIVVMPGPATFQVTTINSATSVKLTFLHYFGDLAPSSTITNGSGVSPSGTQPQAGLTISTSSASSYTITQGTPLSTGISITLPAAGTYQVTATLNLQYTADYNGYNGANPVTLSINRTNNTPTLQVSQVVYPIPNNLATLYGFSTPITLVVLVLIIPAYSTNNATDQLSIFASYLQNLSAGNINVVNQSLIAQQIG